MTIKNSERAAEDKGEASDFERFVIFFKFKQQKKVLDMNSIKAIFENEFIGKTLTYLDWGDEDTPPVSRHYGKKIIDVAIYNDINNDPYVVLIMDDDSEINMIFNEQYTVK